MLLKKSEKSRFYKRSRWIIKWEHNKWVLWKRNSVYKKLIFLSFVNKQQQQFILESVNKMRDINTRFNDCFLFLNFWEFRARIISWLQFNRRNSQFFLNQVLLHEKERYELCDIENMNQTSIAYEFLQNSSYDFKNVKIVWVKTHRSKWDC